ncbi:MAG: hypothetical protein AB7U20_23555 [Planctomycetaceae bacterium]
MSQPASSPEQVVRVLQIITGALVMGVVMFAAIAGLAAGALSGPPSGVIVSGVAVVLAAASFVMHLIVPPVIAKQAGHATDTQGLYGVYQTKTIVGLAILEGAAFFNIVAAMIENNWWSLAIAGGLVFWMLALFPTQTRVAHWVEAQTMTRR